MKQQDKEAIPLWTHHLVTQPVGMASAIACSHPQVFSNVILFKRVLLSLSQTITTIDRYWHVSSSQTYLTNLKSVDHFYQASNVLYVRHISSLEHCFLAPPKFKRQPKYKSLQYLRWTMPKKFEGAKGCNQSKNTQRRQSYLVLDRELRGKTYIITFTAHLLMCPKTSKEAEVLVSLTFPRLLKQRECSMPRTSSCLEILLSLYTTAKKEKYHEISTTLPKMHRLLEARLSL